MKKYIVIREKTISELEHEANSLMNIGFLPSGGIAVNHSARECYQVMYLNEIAKANDEGLG